MSRNPIPASRNALQRNVQLALRKRSYKFEKSDQALRDLKKTQLKKRKVENETSTKEEAANGFGEKDVGESRDVDDLPSHHGCLKDLDSDVIPLRRTEKKQINFKEKLYLAPLTTVSVGSVAQNVVNSCDVCPYWVVSHFVV